MNTSLLILSLQLQQAAAIGLSGRDTNALIHIQLNPDCTIGSIGDVNFYSSTSATLCAEKLEASGYITTTRSAEDRRKYTCRLTDAGQAIVSRITKAAGALAA